jgi:hypothetical protein
MIAEYNYQNKLTNNLIDEMSYRGILLLEMERADLTPDEFDSILQQLINELIDSQLRTFIELGQSSERLEQFSKMLSGEAESDSQYPSNTPQIYLSSS